MNGSDAERAPALETYLVRLDAELAGVAPQDRREILLETRSHVLERAERPPFPDVERVLSELGPPRAYARRFLPEPPAPAPPPNVLTDLARLASGGWKFLPALVAALGAYFLASCFLLIVVWKLTDPSEMKVWVGADSGSHELLIGPDPGKPHMREVLGFAVVPIALMAALSIHLVVSSLLRRLLRGPARPS